MPEGFLPQHGGFRKLRSFQTAQLAYDATVIFCDRFIDKRSRTHDQMVQAARSSVQRLSGVQRHRHCSHLKNITKASHHDHTYL